MRFEFATATQIVFGAGSIQEAVPAAVKMGRHALLVTGASMDRHPHILARLAGQGIRITPFSIGEEPSVRRAQEGVRIARSAGCDLIIALGGGSAIDAGKAIAALLTNEGELIEYLEVIGSGRPLARPAAPFIAIPTTAGTGSEVTRNAVLFSPDHKLKVSMRSLLMLPRLAIVDPELTYDLPPAVTACTGLDALTQVIEPYVSARANPVSDGCCLEGIRRAGRSLRLACEEGRNLSARTDMALASLMGGLALANAGLGVVHGLASPIGGMFRAPHGAVCAALLAPGMEANIRALRARAPQGEALARYQAVAAILTGNPDAAPEDGPAFVRGLCADLSIPPLRQYGLRESDTAELVQRASRASSMKGNPIALAPEELAAVLMGAI